MKKRIMVIVLAILVNMGIAAQGYPVIDVTSILTAIQNGYTMVEQLQAMYTTLKTSYEQLQQQIKNFEAFDLNTLDARDPLGSWRSINTYANRMMTYETNIESIINKKDFKIGNSSYSLKDVFTTPLNKTAQSITTEGLSFVLDPFETRLSPQEKAVFHQKYGMSYGNYMRINQLGELLQVKSAEVAGYSDSLQNNLAEDRERLSTITENLFVSESTIQQQQMNNAIMAIMAQDVKTQANLLGNIAHQLAMLLSQMQIERQAMEDEIDMNNMDISDGFIKMLNEMSPLNMYK